MEKRTKAQIVAESIGEAVKEEAAGIVEMIPVVGKVASKVVEVAQKANEKMKGPEKPPKYVTSVKFCCKKNQIISDQQYTEIVMILQKDYKSTEQESLEDIEYFIDTYVGGEVHTEFVEDCIIKDDYLWIHLEEGVRFLYDGECLQKTLNTLNKLLREEVFERFEAMGHDED